MNKRWDTLFVVLLLLVGFGLRARNLATLPLGFSNEEIMTLRLAESIRNGNVQVFFDTQEAGVEAFFPILIAGVKAVMGDGFFVMRLLSLFASLPMMALTYAIGRRLFGRGVGFIALLMLLVGIWPVLAARTITESSLSALMLLTVLAAALRAFHLDKRIRPLRASTGRYTLLALAIAAAAYEHYTGILAGVGILIFVFYLRYTRQSVSRHVWWSSGYAIILALILGLPYLISVLRIPTFSGPFIFIAERPASPIALLESAGKTLLALFWQGDENPAHNVPSLPLISTPSGVLLILGLVSAARRWREPNYGLLLIFFILGLLPDMWLDGGPDFRALSFLPPLCYLLIGVGVLEIVRIARQQTDLPTSLSWFANRQGWAKWPAPLVYLILLVILLDFGANFVRLRENLFINWPEREDMQAAYHTEVGEIAHYLESLADDTPVMICSSPTPGEVEHSRLLEWMLHREDTQFRVADCLNDFILINGGTPMQVLFVDPTDRSSMPAPLQTWIELADPIALENSNLPEGTAWVLDAQTAFADKGTQLISSNTLYYPREAGNIFETVPLPFHFSDSLTLIGVEPIADQTEFQRGDVLTIVTYWQVDNLLPHDTGIFVRLHDTPQASPYNEINAFGVETKRLHPGDVVIQVGYLILPDTLRAQEYILTLGGYQNRPTNQLPIVDVETGQLRGNYLQFSQPILVTEN